MEDWRVVNMSVSTTAKSMSNLEEIMLGGARQSILLQSENIDNPILLCLHGGPGMPFPGVSCRGVDYVVNLTTKNLIKHFTLVYWDQRGTGKSVKGIPVESYRLEQFISDANELTDYLLKKFGRKKIYLLAISWGSIIGFNLIARYPEKFHAYFGLAQIVNWVESDKIIYQRLIGVAKEKNNQKALKELIQAGEPPYEHPAKWGMMRKWNVRFGALFHKEKGRRTPGFLYSFSLMLKSKDYTFRDMINTITGFPKYYTHQMIQDFNSVNFFESIKRVEVPVYFFHGIHDKNIEGTITERFYNQLEAPNGKQMIWLKYSSHAFYPDDARIVEDFIIQTKLKI
jgi:pimeloyl-ACP methyl ester carboxylesterase